MRAGSRGGHDRDRAAARKAAIAFYTPGIDRLTLADPSYKQHNPVFVKRAEENKVSDIEEFKAAFGPRQGGPGAAAAAWRQDPVTPGRWFEAFTFDSFRTKNGKLVEHWDSALITAPAAPAGAPAGGRGN